MTINIYTITKEERMIGRTARKAGNPTNKHGGIIEMLASQSQETWNAHCRIHEAKKEPASCC